MCGLAGFISPGSESVNDSCLKVMLEAIAHRGPDDSGILIDTSAGLALGHRRLSILDLSDAGHQPMVSACGRFVIAFNGEIYNHMELRRSLGKHICWHGHSDTETLLELIAHEGVESALRAVCGMYAFALWNSRDRSLTLARDRLGEKPLYYGWQGKSFLFGSELKALRRHPDFDVNINWDAASTFLRRNCVPHPATIYEGIFQLPPGSIICLSEKDIHYRNTPEPRFYWSLEAQALRGANEPFGGSYNEAINELDRLIRQSVKRQSLADVQVGAFLSGGVDSSLIVAMLQKETFSRVKTFTVGIPGSILDESAYALKVARHLGTEHIDFQLNMDDILDALERLSDIWDEPFADSSQIPTYLVSQLASKDVTVALTGDGGDEFFLGYSQYQIMATLWRFRSLRFLPLDILSRVFSPLSTTFPGKIRSVAGAWSKGTAQELNAFWMDRYRGTSPPLKVGSELPRIRIAELSEFGTAVGLWDAVTFLPDDVLVKVDRASMANSLETRAPLLDHHVVEFALSLPQRFKLERHTGKKVLRELLYKYVPRWLVDRPKAGFSIPLGSWLRGELRPWAEAGLAGIPNDSLIFDRAQVADMWDEHLLGKRDNSDRLWGILVLQRFLDS